MEKTIIKILHRICLERNWLSLTSLMKQRSLLPWRQSTLSLSLSLIFLVGQTELRVDPPTLSLVTSLFHLREDS